MRCSFTIPGVLYVLKEWSCCSLFTALFHCKLSALLYMLLHKLECSTLTDQGQRGALQQNRLIEEQE